MSYLLKRIFACLSVLCLADFSNGSPVNKTTFDQRQTGEYNVQISLKDIRIFALLSGGLGGPEDYDYNYDYSEMTIKPPKVNGTTLSNDSVTPVTNASAPSTTPKINAESTTERIVEITPATLPTSTKMPILFANNLTKIDINNATVSKNQTDLENYSTVSKKPTLSTSTIQPLTVQPDYSTGIPVRVIITPLEVASNTGKRGSDGTTENLDASQTSSAINPHNNSTKVRRADCVEGFRKDKQGNCRPRVKKPQQQTLLRKLIQLSKRLQPSRPKNVNNDSEN